MKTLEEATKTLAILETAAYLGHAKDVASHLAKFPEECMPDNEPGRIMRKITVAAAALRDAIDEADQYGGDVQTAEKGGAQ
jgi:hypothetical protein